ncbi:DUF4429 domain-containing protein [Nocardiopsis sp. NPDC058631]|uniref:DUF4429 domain-containing protein n=1 Tax=Nocardiopsis sp. NPDC058631 TaxID=3346566 RepID=UPI003668EF49
MDELRGDQAVWRFDGESIAIRYETKGLLRDPLLKRLQQLELPVGAIAEVDFRPGGGKGKGWLLQLRLRDRMDPYAAVGAMLKEKSQPFRLTGHARTELVAEYLADQIRFAAEQHSEPPAPDAVTHLVPRLPFHIQTSEGTATIDGSGVRLVWSGGEAGGRKRKAQRREYDLAAITGVEWAPSDGWEWGYLRVITADRAKQGSGKLKQDLDVLVADEGAEGVGALLMAATITAHTWAAGAAGRARPGSEVAAGPADPRWWLDAARAVRQLGGPTDDRSPAATAGTDTEGTAGPDGTGRTAVGTDTGWIFEQIERLGELHAKGLLTDEEFSAKKAELLGRI